MEESVFQNYLKADTLIKKNRDILRPSYIPDNLPHRDYQIDQLASIYRLPTEEEWEWAAGGEADGAAREYPWPKDKGKPNQNLANYGKHVGATTPVDRYPEGATPTGLMDMLGNVWEWMENYSSESREFMALRGGAYYSDEGSLVCSSRGVDLPGDSWDVNGFRVVRSATP